MNTCVFHVLLTKVSKPLSGVRTKDFWFGLVAFVSLMVFAPSGHAQSTVTPTTVAFGNQVISQTSALKTTTFKNAGAVALTISSITIAGPAPADYTLGGNCPLTPGTLGAGKTCSINVTFTPLALGSRTATLTITHSATTSPQSVALTGTGVAPVTLSAATLAFGNQAQGTASATKTETLKNQQVTPLTISTIAVSGDFARVGGTCPITPSTLPGGASCTVLLSFSPAIVGVEMGTLTVTDNASNSPQTASLTGTGIAPVTLSAASLSFGSVYVGNKSATKSVILTNRKNTALTFASIASTGDFAIASNTCGASIAAGATCTVGVTISPTFTGARTGTLSFADSAANTPQTVSLTGTGSAPVTVSPTTLTFASRSIGTVSAAQNVTLTNHLSTSLAMSAISANGDFSVSSNTCGSSVGAGLTCAVGVKFTPTVVGTRTGALTINHSAFGSPTLVALTGTGNATGLISIAVTPANPSIFVGQSQQFVATGTFTGPRTADISTSVAWSSSVTPVASISNAAGSQGLAAGLAQGTSKIASTLNAINGSTNLTITAPVLKSIDVTPANPAVSVGSTEQFTATGTYSDGSSQNLTGSAIWSSSTSSVATVGATGLGVTAGLGQTLIQVSSGGVSGSTTLTVTAGFLPTGSLNIARSQEHTATLLNNGMVLIAGGVDSSGGYLSSAELYDPASRTFRATGNMNNARFGHTATLLNNGRVLIVGGLNSALTLTSAELYDPATGTFTLTGALNTSRYNHTATLLNDGTVLIAGGYNYWGSGSPISASAELYDPPAGTFAPTGNLNTARAFSTATLVNNGAVLIAGGIDANGELASAELYDTVNRRFALTGNLKVGRQKATATLLNSGLVLIAAGNGDISVGHLATAELYDPSTGTFTATGSLNTARSYDTATLLNNGTVLFAGGENGTPLSSAELYDPRTQIFTATGSLNSTREIHTAVLLKDGTVLIEGGSTAGGGTLASAELYEPGSPVLAGLVSISVNPVGPTIPLATSQRFTAAGTFGDASTQTLSSVTWSTSNSAIATVTNDSSNHGEAYASAIGSATVGACVGLVCGSTTLTIGAPALISIAVSPTNGTVPAGLSVQFQASGTYTDGSTQDVTNTATWTSSATPIATINSVGLASGFTVGVATISASSGSIHGTAALMVKSPVLSSISVTPANTSISAGTTQQFTAQGTFTDGSKQDLSTIVTWSSSATSVATISSTGFASSVSQGIAIMTAASGSISGSISGSTNLTITSPVLKSIAVTPMKPSISVGSTQQFTATGTYSDGSTQDLTNAAVWISSAPSVAAMSTSTAYAATVGSATISACADAVCGSATLKVSGGFIPAGSLNTARSYHSATLLNNGMVLIAGGYGTNGGLLSSAELYDPAAGNFVPTGNLNTARYYHTATLLHSGFVLIAGGYGSGGYSASVELYNPATGAFTPTGNLNTARYFHTATLLNSGKVLIVGGLTNGVFSSRAELFDPATGTFSDTGDLNVARYLHTATLLNNGKVLIAGGLQSTDSASAELYDPATGTFTSVGSLNTARESARATLLNGGMVLMSGGDNHTTGRTDGLTSAELFDPNTGMWTSGASLDAVRSLHTATLLTNGTVLIAGGYGATNNSLASADLYDTASQVYTVSGSLISGRFGHTATLLQNGLVLIVGGINTDSAIRTLASAELYGPNSLMPAGLAGISVSPPAPTIPLGTSQRFVTSGTFSDGTTQPLSSVIWDSSNDAITTVTNDSSDPGAAYAVAIGSATIRACAGTICGVTTLTVGPPTLVSLAVTPATSSIAIGLTQQFMATGLFTDGSTRNLTTTVLWSSTSPSIGGISNTSGSQGLATGSSTGIVTLAATLGTITGSTVLTVIDATTGILSTARYGQSATLLNNGQVLMAGGQSSASLITAELYNPATHSFSATGNLNHVRLSKVSALLQDGRVLIAGGLENSIDVNSTSSQQPSTSTAELYDPSSGIFTLTGSLVVPRSLATATVLNDGRVLITGGSMANSNNTIVSSAELYDPRSGGFTPTGGMASGRQYHTATLLNSGKVLIAGGIDASGFALFSIEIYDPATGTFSAGGRMASARFLHAATLLDNGLVLIAGGSSTNVYTNALATAELYDPSTNASVGAAGNMNTVRYGGYATLLNSGQVLMNGGSISPTDAGKMELYDPRNGTFAATSTMVDPREGHTATVLRDGTVLLAGGVNIQNTTVGSAELYEPGQLTPPNLVSISVNPIAPTVSLGSGLHLTAIATFADGSTQTLASVTWSSSNNPIATLTNDATDAGAAFGRAVGTASVGACAGSVCGSETLTVVPVLLSIAVSPVNASIPAGLSTPFHVSGTYNDGSTQDLTSAATWNSSSLFVATINSAGVASSFTPGSTMITATLGTMQSNVTLLVGAATLQSIAISPSNASIPMGITEQATATGMFTDGTIQNLSSAVTWVSSAPGVATISNSGLANTVAQGSTVITATLGSMSGSTGLTVAPPTLTSIVITPANPSIGLGSSKQLSALGTYTDGSSQDISDAVSWSSSSSNIATVGSTGLANGVAPGQATIQAVSGTIASSATVTIAGFISSGSMSTPRQQYTATLLNNGMVLLAGGVDASGAPLASAELYDPSTQHFTQTGSMTTARYTHAAVLLNNGEVLILGGGSQSGNLLSSELFNPVTGTFASSGIMTIARYGPTATVLESGKVLVTGGNSSSGFTASAELYDQVAQSFTAIGSMSSTRFGHTATLLNNGMVLIAGGNDGATYLASADLYDPSTNSFAPTGSMVSARGLHTATLLNGGKVLVSGGNSNSGILSSAELFDPVTGNFTATGGMNTPRYGHAATLITNGEVLVSGGYSGSFLKSAELFEAASGTFTSTGNMSSARVYFTSTLLNNGTVLAAGGNSGSIAVPTADLFDPGALTPVGLDTILVAPVSPTLLAGCTQHFIAIGKFSDNTTQQLASVLWSSSDGTVAQIANDVSDRGFALAATAGTVTINGCAGSVCGLASETVIPK